MNEVNLPKNIDFFTLVKQFDKEIVFSSNPKLNFHSNDIASFSETSKKVEIICNFMGLRGTHGALPYQWLHTLAFDEARGELIKIFENRLYHSFYHLCNPLFIGSGLFVQDVQALMRERLSSMCLKTLASDLFFNLDFQLMSRLLSWTHFSTIQHLGCAIKLGDNCLLGNRILTTRKIKIIFHVSNHDQLDSINKKWSFFCNYLRNCSVVFVQSIKFCNHAPTLLGKGRLGCCVLSPVYS